MAILASEKPLAPINIGVDIGQLQDPSAIAVAEAIRKDTGKIRRTGEARLGRYDNKGFWIPPQGAEPIMITEYMIRNIHRLPLNTSYPDVATYLADLLCNDLLKGRQIKMLIDVTGVGRPVYQMLLDELTNRRYALDMNLYQFQERYKITVAPITFVHGETYNRKTGSLGKAYLVSRLQSLLQSNLVHAPKTAEVLATLDELRVYEIKVSQDGKDTYGGKVGYHDDLATALGLAVLEDLYGDAVTYSNRVY